MSMSNQLVRSARGLVGGDEPSSIVTGSAALLAGFATRELITLAWRRWKGEDPPRNPAATSTSWGDAIAWTLAISVTVGTARLLARRGAAAALEHAH